MNRLSHIAVLIVAVLLMAAEEKDGKAKPPSELKIHKQGKWWQYAARGASVWRKSRVNKEPAWEWVDCDWVKLDDLPKEARAQKKQKKWNTPSRKRLEEIMGPVDPENQMVLNLQYSGSRIPSVRITRVVKDRQAGTVNVYIDWRKPDPRGRAASLTHAGLYAIVDRSELPIRLIVTRREHKGEAPPDPPTHPVR